MEKFWIVLLSVTLTVAFAMPVSAADVKFGGSYVAQGYYENNRALLKDGGASLMNVWQRLRLQADFNIQEGLNFTTRADILEKIWGAQRNAGGSLSGYTPGAPLSNPNGVDSESENIKFTYAYVTANLWGGVLRAGYQGQAKFGTDFGDSGEQYYGRRVRYDYPVGPWTFVVLWDKIEGSEYYSPAGPSGNVGVTSYQVDSQADKFIGCFGYDWGKGNAGLLIYYYLITNTSGPSAVPDTGYKSKYWIFDPYVKVQVGPAYFEAEVNYITGKSKAWESPGAINPATGLPVGPDVDKSGWEAYASLTYDFAPAYAGSTVVWVQGDDPSTTDKNEAGVGGGTDFNPCLILFNYDLGRWEGKMGNPANFPVVAGASTLPSMSGGISNAFLLQVFAGIRPVPKLDLKASFTWAQADRDVTATNWQSKDYGRELDITATYKIYDNLSYMVGFAYLWAGDYWKGTDPGANIDNDYLVTHKLTLSF
ncbi:MAG TPA: hypothetical protein VFG29_00980 [Syntrophales bacterium]|nr:hypothetical protein [Syntrophales bacterium]